MSDNINNVRDELRKEIKDAGMELYAQGSADALEGMERALQAVADKFAGSPFHPGLLLAVQAIKASKDEMTKVADAL